MFAFSNHTDVNGNNYIGTCKAVLGKTSLDYCERTDYFKSGILPFLIKFASCGINGIGFHAMICCAYIASHTGTTALISYLSESSDNESVCRAILTIHAVLLWSYNASLDLKLFPIGSLRVLNQVVCKYRGDREVVQRFSSCSANMILGNDHIVKRKEEWGATSPEYTQLVGFLDSDILPTLINFFRDYAPLMLPENSDSDEFLLSCMLQSLARVASYTGALFSWDIMELIHNERAKYATDSQGIMEALALLVEVMQTNF